MKTPLLFLFVLVALCPATADAHVQVAVPASEAGGVCEFDLRLVEHASRNGPALPMSKPRKFGVVVNGKQTELSELVKPRQSGGMPAFSAKYTMKEAGAHIFFLEPAPYWEPAEDVMVTHYAKVIVNSCKAGLPTKSNMGWENWEGWDALVGFPVEIEPLVQCTSLWTGSAFTGIVRVNGKPAPFCRVEIEFLDERGEVKLPDNSHLTQILKTNGRGEFTYVPVRAGWWALTAIPEAKQTTRNPEGRKVKAELGGVLWIRCTDMGRKSSNAGGPCREDGVALGILPTKTSQSHIFIRNQLAALGRVSVGHCLAYEPCLSLIPEDAQGICGYALGALDSRASYARYEAEWRPELCAR
jgi:cobalt/nickel transport protein